MARKRKSRRPNPQGILLLFFGLILGVCAASIAYGFLLRHGGSGGGRLNFRIEVLNGTGERGLARRAARVLMRSGVDVLRVGNASDFSYSESILIARKRNARLKVLARLLNCQNLIEQLEPGAIADATLILGTDYKKLKLGLGRDSYLP